MHKPLFQIGDEVEVSMIGKVTMVKEGGDGKPYYEVIYRHEGAKYSDQCFVNEECLSTLPAQGDFRVAMDYKEA